jgi:hypothetical protein
LGTDELKLAGQKYELRRAQKIAASIVVLVLVIGLVGWYINATTPTEGELGPFAVTITPDNPCFNQGENVTFTVTIINNQVYPVQYPSLEDVSITRNGLPCVSPSLNVDYAVGKVPTYPANSNSSYSWRWFESKIDNQIIPHETGSYALTYRIKGNGYDVSADCTFEIR